MMFVVSAMGFALHVHHIWHFRWRRCVQHQRHVMHSGQGVHVRYGWRWHSCIQAIGGTVAGVVVVVRVGNERFLERITGMRMRMGLNDGGCGEHLLEAIGCLQLLQLQMLLLQELLTLQL